MRQRGPQRHAAHVQLATQFMLARQALPAEVELHELKSRFKLLYFPEYAISFFRNCDLSTIDVVFATGVVSSWLGTILSTFLPRHPALLCGVYTTSEFCYRGNKSLISYGDNLRTANFDRHIPDRSKLFPSERIRQLHEHGLGRSLAASPICVLPLDTSMFENVRRKPDRYKIVSIGRLTAYKTYNLNLIPIVRSLRDKGCAVRWHVYGTGELEPAMRRKIKELGLEAAIHLHGNLEYRRLPEALADAGVFVGMGTAVFEAAFCHVPSIVALENDRDALTYGCLYDHPLGTNGEWLSEPPSRKIGPLLERLVTCSEIEYAQEMERHWRYVQAFDQEQVIAKLQGHFENAKPCRASYLDFAAYNTHGILRLVRRAIKSLRWKSHRT